MQQARPIQVQSVNRGAIEISAKTLARIAQREVNDVSENGPFLYRIAVRCTRTNKSVVSFVYFDCNKTPSRMRACALSTTEDFARKFLPQNTIVHGTSYLGWRIVEFVAHDDFNIPSITSAWAHVVLVRASSSHRERQTAPLTS